MNIAIMGGSSHIAENLIVRFGKDPDIRLTLFCRQIRPVQEFVSCFVPDGNIEVIGGYGDFNDHDFDVLINCVGAGAPGKSGFDPRNWFDLTADFDDLALNYLEKINPQAILITFSSGAVYGTGNQPPFTEESCLSLPVNNIRVSDYYSIARIHAEAKHRSRPELRIADLRIFSFFSRFIPLDSGYFMSDVLKAAAWKKPLTTANSDMMRDYIAPDDLFDLINCCIAQEKINGAFDVCSLAPAGKFEILESFREKFGLEWIFSDVPESPNSSKSIYASSCRHLEKIGFTPRFTSLQALILETDKFLSDKELYLCRTN